MSSSVVPKVSKTVVANLTISGHVMNTSCVKWSADNCIAIIIDKHIYLLSSRTDPTVVTQQFPYHKSIIPNMDKSVDFNCGLNVRQVLAASSLDEQQILMCDRTLAGETSNSVTFRGYRQIDWSPICRDCGCLLAALTLDYRLVVYCKHFNGWKQTIDLTLLLNQNLKEFWKDSDRPSYHTYRTRMYSLATNAFCWAKNWSQKTLLNNCLLFLGSKNGLITFWEISIGSDLTIEAKLVYKWETTYDQINCLKSFDNYLLISSINGTVNVIFTDFSFDSSPNPLTLWSEKDNISANDFAVKPFDENSFDVLFAKSDFIIICRFSADTKDDRKQMNVKFCKSVLGLHQMPSTAVCDIIGNKYLLTALDGRLIQIEVTEDSTVTQKEVTLDCVNSSSMCSHGIEQSPNGALSVLVRSLTPMHDHLIVKEPVQVVVFSNLSFDNLTDILSEKYLNSKTIKDKSSTEECFDYFDCIRSFLSNSLYSGFNTNLFALIDGKNLVNESNDLLGLKVYRFLTKAYISRNIKNQTDSDVCKRLEFNVRLCEDLILKVYIENVFKRVVCNLQNLTESQLLSLKNMDLWYFKRFSQRLIAGNTIDFNSVQEVCPICEEPIPLDNKHFSSCGQSHRFNRCVNSLVLCDFVKYKYKKCFRCHKSIVISPSIWEQSSICLYCD